MLMEASGGFVVSQLSPAPGSCPRQGCFLQSRAAGANRASTGCGDEFDFSGPRFHALGRVCSFCCRGLCETSRRCCSICEALVAGVELKRSWDCCSAGVSNVPWSWLSTRHRKLALRCPGELCCPVSRSFPSARLQSLSMGSSTSP